MATLTSIASRLLGGPHRFAGIGGQAAGAEPRFRETGGQAAGADPEHQLVEWCLNQFGPGYSSLRSAGLDAPGGVMASVAAAESGSIRIWLSRTELVGWPDPGWPKPGGPGWRSASVGHGGLPWPAPVEALWEAALATFAGEPGAFHEQRASHAWLAREGVRLGLVALERRGRHRARECLVVTREGMRWAWDAVRLDAWPKAGMPVRVRAGARLFYWNGIEPAARGPGVREIKIKA